MLGVYHKAPAWLAARGYSPVVTMAYAALAAVFLVLVAQFYIPGKGISYLIAFGSDQEAARLSKVRKLDYYVDRGSAGYDAQYYVQIAMDPSLQNQGLKRAVDSLAYRARRILFPATAFVFGLGEPAWILQAYALLNVVSWLLLAVLLLHWFPPRSWENFLRWAGVLFSSGLCLSFRNALIDGPSLLLIALGVYLLEKGRPWWSTAILALGGLGKETNLLGAAALLPPWPAHRRDWMLAVGRGLLTVTPLGLWIVYIAVVIGPAVDPGVRNFALPLMAYLHKWQEVADSWHELNLLYTYPLWSLCMLVALTVQMLYLLLRPDWQKAWWRIGLSYAVLMIFLGDAVWEGVPGAASRVLLPMQLAFNVLVPSGRRWFGVLLLGNLTVFGAFHSLQSPPGEGYDIGGSSELLYAPDSRYVQLHYVRGWHMVESYGAEYWCWSSGPADLVIDNPQTFSLLMKLHFGLSVADAREVRILLNGQEIWRVIQPRESFVDVTLYDLPLTPGANRLALLTDKPALKVGTDPRPLAIKLQNLRIDLKSQRH